MQATFAVYKSRTANWRPAYAKFTQAHELNNPSGYPPPPPTVIWGILAAALGEYATPPIAYEWISQNSFCDLQTLQSASHRDARKPLRGGKSSNPMPASIPTAYNCELRIYVQDPGKVYFSAFQHPIWPISFGRKEDLAYLEKISQRELEAADGDVIFQQAVVPVSEWKGHLSQRCILNSSSQAAPHTGKRYSRQYVPSLCAICNGTYAAQDFPEVWQDPQRKTGLIWHLPKDKANW
jgi:hypothetical protein